MRRTFSFRPSDKRGVEGVMFLNIEVPLTNAEGLTGAV